MYFHDCNGMDNKKLIPKEENVIKWHRQAVSIATNIRVKIDSTLPELIATKIVTWNYHVYDSSKGRYDIILGRYILTDLGLNLK